MDLKELIDDEELYKQVKEKIGDKKLVLDDGNLVSKADYIPRKVYNEDKMKLQSMIDERDKDLENLKDELKKSEGAAEKIAELQRKNVESEKKYKTELDQTSKKAAVEVALIKAQAKHPDLMLHKINLESVTKHGDNFIGIDEQIEALKKEGYEDQFGKPVVEGDPPIDGNPSQPKTKLVELQKRYDDVAKQFGQSSPQAIAVKNELFDAQRTSA